MKLFIGTKNGWKFSISVTPANERTRRDLAVGAIAGPGGNISNMIEREYTSLSFDEIRKDMRQLLLESVY